MVHRNAPDRSQCKCGAVHKPSPHRELPVPLGPPRGRAATTRRRGRGPRPRSPTPAARAGAPRARRPTTAGRPGRPRGRRRRRHLATCATAPAHDLGMHFLLEHELRRPLVCKSYPSAGAASPTNASRQHEFPASARRLTRKRRPSAGCSRSGETPHTRSPHVNTIYPLAATASHTDAARQRIFPRWTIHRD